VLWRVVGAIWNNSVCEGRFSENACVHASGGFADSYVHVVKFMISFLSLTMNFTFELWVNYGITLECVHHECTKCNDTAVRVGVVEHN